MKHATKHNVKQTTETNGKSHGLSLVVSDKLTINNLSLRVQVDENTPGPRVIAEVHDTLRALEKLGRATKHIKFILGQLLYIVAERELFKPQFPTLEGFLTALEEKYDLGRSNLLEGYQIVKQLPTVTEAKFEQIGPTALLEAARVAGRAETPKEAAKVHRMIEKAETAAELRTALGPVAEASGVKLTRSGVTGDGFESVTFRVSRRIMKMWDELRGEYAAIVGTSQSDQFAFFITRVHQQFAGAVAAHGGPAAPPGLSRKQSAAARMAATG